MSTATLDRPTVEPRLTDELLPAVRDYADSLAAFPSRNDIMRRFSVGAKRAQGLRAAILAEPVVIPDEAADEPLVNPWDLAGPVAEPAPVTVPAVPSVDLAAASRGRTIGNPAPVAEQSTPDQPRKLATWPVILIALPAFVAIWSGWVGLGGLTGFGVVHPLPGIADGFSINTAITLPIGVEVYAAYALRAWLSGLVPPRARRFAKWSAIGSLLVGALGQVAYHLLVAAGITSAPWWITTLVACLPVAVLGMAAALAHLSHGDTP